MGFTKPETHELGDDLLIWSEKVCHAGRLYLAALEEWAAIEADLDDDAVDAMWSEDKRAAVKTNRDNIDTEVNALIDNEHITDLCDLL